MRGRVLALAAVLLTARSCTGPGGDGRGGVGPGGLHAPVANPYFPLKAGTVFVYRGTEDRDRLVEHLTRHRPRPR